MLRDTTRRPIVRKQGVEEVASGPRPTRTLAKEWTILAWAGAAFMIVGGADLALIWYPPNFGDPEWEFGTLTASLDSLPLYSIGAVFLLCFGLVRGHRLAVRGVATLFALTAAAVVVGALLYLTTVPIVLNAASDRFMRLGLGKAILKTSLEIAVYAPLFLILAVKAWRGSAGRS